MPADSPTIAVTGAAGYIGSRVISLLQDQHPSWSITALDNFYRGSVDAIGDTTVQHLDIRNRSRLEAHLEGADVVMHLAAISGVDDCETNADLAYEVNVLGTEHVAWFCRKHGAGLVFPFSMAVLGDPESFPITTEASRDPKNWYGRSKLLNERAIETFAEGSFPAHLFLKSNIYGEHQVGDTVVSKSTVINFFVNRAFAEEPLTVYEPGTQSRNFIHVKDVAAAYPLSAEQLLSDLEAGETGVQEFTLATDEDPSVMAIAELVQSIMREETGTEPSISLIENPRSGETLVSDFTVDTTRTQDILEWKPTHAVESSIRELIRARIDT